jgi:hypothetical protein
VECDSAGALMPASVIASAAAGENSVTFAVRASRPRWWPVALDGVEPLRPVAGGVPPHFSATPTRSSNNWT